MKKTRHLISVYVTDDAREHTGTRWKLYSGHPSRQSAWAAARRALKSGYRYAKLVETRIFKGAD